MKKLFSTKNRLLSLALSLALLIAAVFPGKSFAAEAEDNPGISGAYAMLEDEDLFINEEVAYYAFTTLECGALTKTFVKICDGVTSGNRYILTDQIRTSGYYDVTPYEV